CTIGGNVGTNAGGAHCLGYGITSNYVLELEYVDPSGILRRAGGKTSLCPYLDLRGLLVGSEGTLGIVTAVRLRLIPEPEHIGTIFAEFAEPGPAIRALVEIFRQGDIPEALDLTCGVCRPGVAGPVWEGTTYAYIDLEGFRACVERRTARITAI